MSKLLVNTLLIFIILFFACKDSPFSNSSTTNTTAESVAATDTIVEASPTPTITEIYTWVNELRMREEPSTNSPIVFTLKEGEPLEYAGEKSDFTEKISLRGTRFDEPWLKVTTKSGKEGWVYGGGVKFYKVGADKSSTPYDDCFKLVKDRKIAQSQKCFDRVQFRQLKDNASLVTASASGIDFRLLNEEQFSLQNAGRDTVYDFRYYLKNMGFFAILATYRDSSEYVLVNDKSGEILTLKGYPKASPDGNHIAGVGSDWKGTGEAFNGVQILSYGEEGFTIVFEEEVLGYNPVTPKWVDDNTLQINLLDINNRRKSKLAQLTKEESGEWSLEY